MYYLCIYVRSSDTMASFSFQNPHCRHVFYIEPGFFFPPVVVAVSSFLSNRESYNNEQQKTLEGKSLLKTSWNNGIWNTLTSSDLLVEPSPPSFELTPLSPSPHLPQHVNSADFPRINIFTHQR